MAINTFCTTFCAALFTLAAAPAMAFVIPPETRQDAATTTGGEAYRKHAAFSQRAGHLVLDAGTSAGMLTTEALPGSGNDAMAQFWQPGAGGMAVRPLNQEESQPVPLPETGNLPLLGAAGVALLVAQLRRSRRPAVR
jgi:hypothetical protein